MGLGVLIVALGVYLARRSTEPRPTPPAAATEGCLTCHDAARERPPGIHAAVAGCEACHLGDPGAAEKDAAHVGLELEPGALDTAEKTCGRGGCHPSQLSRVRGSLMHTARGLVAVDRWAFGELDTPTSTQTAADVLAAAHPTPAQDHLRRLCLGCHLGVRKDNRDDMLAGTSSGCSACHVAPRPTDDAPHPAFDRASPDQRCFGCHSRSARVSLSYKGWAEVRGPELEACPAPIELADGRRVCRVEADVHAQAGLSCVDCHLHTELMGDGESYAHEEQQVEVRCESCHGPAGGLETSWGEVEDPTSRRLLELAGWTVTATSPARTGRRGTPLYNLFAGPEGWQLRSKLGAGARSVPPTPDDAAHTIPGHERVSCAACHAAWAPTCPTCHTGYRPDGEQWDFGRTAVAEGRWVEEADRYFARPPTLARRGDRVVPAAPGMIATLDARAAGGARRHGRWFSAFDPHTTARAPRDCAGCHLDPRALGLGTGKLSLQPEPRFEPEGGGPANSPAPDGWQGLFPATPGQGTRPEVRGLDAPTQWRMLRVGACMGCHRAEKGSIFFNFSEALGRLRAGKARSCRQRDHAWLHSLPRGAEGNRR